MIALIAAGETSSMRSDITPPPSSSRRTAGGQVFVARAQPSVDLGFESCSASARSQMHCLAPVQTGGVRPAQRCRHEHSGSGGGDAAKASPQPASLAVTSGASASSCMIASAGLGCTSLCARQWRRLGSVAGGRGNSIRSRSHIALSSSPAARWAETRRIGVSDLDARQIGVWKPRAPLDLYGKAGGCVWSCDGRQRAHSPPAAAAAAASACRPSDRSPSAAASDPEPATAQEAAAMSAEVTQQLDRAMVDDLFGGASEYARPLVVSPRDRVWTAAVACPAASMAAQPAGAEAAITLTACVFAAVPKQEIQAAAFLKVGDKRRHLLLIAVVVHARRLRSLQFSRCALPAAWEHSFADMRMWLSSGPIVFRLHSIYGRSTQPMMAVAWWWPFSTRVSTRGRRACRPRPTAGPRCGSGCEDWAASFAPCRHSSADTCLPLLLHFISGGRSRVGRRRQQRPCLLAPPD